MKINFKKIKLNEKELSDITPYFIVKFKLYVRASSD